MTKHLLPLKATSAALAAALLTLGQPSVAGASTTAVSCPKWTQPTSVTGDTYRCFAELQAAEPASAYSISKADRNTALAVIAIHGGGIEKYTSNLTTDIAGSTQSWYKFEGLKTTDNTSLHITSTNFDEPVGWNLVTTSKRVLSLHGVGVADDGDPACTTYVGGADTNRAEAVRKQLADAGFSALPPSSTSGIEGTDPHNIANRGTSGAGVQLELTKAQRYALYAGQTDLCGTGYNHTKTQYVNAVKAGMGIS